MVSRRCPWSARHPRTPRWSCTPDSRRRDLPERCRALGAVGFLEKTASPERIVDELLAALNPHQVQHEHEWAESGEMLRQLVEAVQDYAIFMLDPEGRVASWNPGAERSKQWTAEEIIGQHFRVFYPPEKQAVRHPERELEIALREGRYEEEGWRVRKDGSRFWAHVDDHDGPRLGRHASSGSARSPATTRRCERPRPGSRRPTQCCSRRRGPGPFPGDDHARAAFAGGRPRQHGEAPARALGPLGDDERKELLDGMAGSAGRLGRLLADLLTASRVQSTALDLDVRELDLVEQLQRIVRQFDPVRRRRRGPVGRRAAGPRPGGSGPVGADRGEPGRQCPELRRGARRHHR